MIPRDHDLPQINQAKPWCAKSNGSSSDENPPYSKDRNSASAPGCPLLHPSMTPYRPTRARFVETVIHLLAQDVNFHAHLRVRRQGRRLLDFPPSRFLMVSHLLHDICICREAVCRGLAIRCTLKKRSMFGKSRERIPGYPEQNCPRSRKWASSSVTVQMSPAPKETMKSPGTIRDLRNSIAVSLLAMEWTSAAVSQRIARTIA